MQPTRDIADTLRHALTRYDRKQESRPGYNVYALARYLQLADEIGAAVTAGDAPRTAILTRTHDRLCDACLRAVGEPIATRDEIRLYW